MQVKDIIFLVLIVKIVMHALKDAPHTHTWTPTVQEKVL